MAELPLWQQGVAAAEQDCPAARPIHQRIRACKAVLAAMADDLITTTAARVDEMKLDSPDAARKAGQKAVAFSPDLARAVREMQDFLLHKVYLRPDAEKKERESRRLIQELFAAFTGSPDLLPSRYQTRIDADGLHRVVCDYIAGMTDRFCKDQHAVVCGAMKPE